MVIVASMGVRNRLMLQRSLLNAIKLIVIATERIRIERLTTLVGERRSNPIKIFLKWSTLGAHIS